MNAFVEKVLGRPDLPGVARLVEKEYLAVQSAGSGMILAEADDATMSIGGVISDESRDRVGDEVVSLGGDWSLHEQAPSVFVNHQDGLDGKPIGRARDRAGRHTVRPQQTQILGRIFYTEAIPEGKQFYLLGKDGSFSGLSISFIPTTEPIRLQPKDGNPFAGFRYPKWLANEFSQCGVPCHGRATLKPKGMREEPAEILRAHLSRGKIGGEKISGLVRKALAPFANPKKAVLWTGEGNMDKALTGTSGTQGGYTEPGQTVAKPDGPDPAADKEHMKTAILGVMHRHKDNAPAGGPHHAYWHHENKSVHHHHHPHAHPTHLKDVKGDLEGIPGVEHVAQAEVAPEGQGWELAGAGAEPLHTPEVHHPAVPHGEEGEVKAWLKKAARFSDAFSVWPSSVVRMLTVALKKKASDKVQECVGKKIPILLEEGYPQDQAEAIAYSMCGEKKDFGDSEEATPDGAALCQEVIDLVERAMERLEPELQDFWNSVLGDVVDHGRERYPDKEFGRRAGHGDTDGDDAEAEAALEEYQKPPSKRQRKPRMTRLKAYRVLKGYEKRHVKTVGDARDHLGELSDKPKGSPFTHSEKTACSVHHKALHSMHKDMTQGECEDEPSGTPEKREKAVTVEDLKALKTDFANELAELLKPSAEALFRMTGDRNLHTLLKTMPNGGRN